MDAEWYIRANAAYESSGRSILPPERSEALGALADAVRGQQPVVFQTASEEEYLRAYKIASEYKLKPWFRGSGMEYRLVDVLKGRTAPLILPLNFPDAPDVSSPEKALEPTLAQLLHWYHAPTNPAQMANAGVPFALTTDGLSTTLFVLGAKKGLELIETLPEYQAVFVAADGKFTYSSGLASPER